MSDLTLGRERLRDLVACLLDAYPRVIAPVALSSAEATTPGARQAHPAFGPSTGVVAFQPVLAPEEACFDFVNSTRSIKDCFLPPSEPLFSFEQAKGEGQLRPSPPDEQATVIVGSRPCDAASLPLLDRVFTEEPSDERWARRRGRTTVVTIACSYGDPYCFCTSVGLAPDSPEGSDVLLVPRADGRYAVRTLTAKGSALLETVGSLLSSSDPAESRLADVPERFDIESAQAWLRSHFDDDSERSETPRWAELAFACLGCGVCTYLCPTCYCFDIIDEGNTRWGTRRRNWDSCSFGLFTEHASGHNPRPTVWRRWRQRLQHKFNYFAERFAAVACTGCGRCRRHCPVALGVEDTLTRIAPAR